LFAYKRIASLAPSHDPIAYTERQAVGGAPRHEI